MNALIALFALLSPSASNAASNYDQLAKLFAVASPISARELGAEQYRPGVCLSKADIAMRSDFRIDGVDTGPLLAPVFRLQLSQGALTFQLQSVDLSLRNGSLEAKDSVRATRFRARGGYIFAEVETGSESGIADIGYCYFWLYRP